MVKGIACLFVLFGSLLIPAVAEAQVAPAPVVAPATTVALSVSSCTPKNFTYRQTTNGSRLWYGSFKNSCHTVSFYIRADLSGGPDSADKLVGPGQTVTWSDDPVSGAGTEFRAWKACRYARCP